MSVYVGIDVHRKRSQIAVVDHDGAVQVNRNVPNGVKTVLSVIGDLPIGAPVAFEAAYGWGWLVELLEDYGFEPHLVHPLRCKAIASARLLAQARGDPRIKVLTRLPGVGTLTALVIAAEVGDITRFPSARKLTAWAGLTPTVRASDLTVRHGHISKQGSDWLRWILCEAAQSAKRSPEFAVAYQRLAHRRGKKIATTAIARRLLARAYHLLRAVQGQLDRQGAR
ncbi:transposase [Streptomyces sp. NPDC056309]|uniref:transposase n=1 Tax=unclassified Streptomyces TaxID=2593676 RepID=UPI0035D86643